MALETSITKHFLVLRKHLLRSLYALVILFLILYYFSNDLFEMLSAPLLKYLPQKYLIATQVVSPLTVPLKFTLILTFLLGIPYFLYECWMFIAPGLYRKEKNYVRILIVPSILLFYTGILFCFFVVFPLIFSFFAHMLPKGVMLMPDIDHYLDFCMQLFIAFGLCFQIPVITAALILTGIVSEEQLKTWRPYFIVLAFIVGMLLAPPDVFSQTALAIPMCLLFEAGLIFARLVKRTQL